MMTDIKKIVDLIYKKKNILILPHILPDGDTIGSSLALYFMLKDLGKIPCILLDEEIPYNIKFLPHQYICKALDDDFIPDLVISIDCSDLERLGNRRKYIDRVQESLNIDHHVTNTFFAKYNFVDSSAAATGEIIFEVIQSMQAKMTKDIATCLYTALSTDTGSFKYDNTSPRTHTIVAELLQCSIDLNYINTEIYQNKPINKIKLLTDVLNTLEFYFSGKLAMMCITENMLKKNNIKLADIDGLIEFARDIDGVEVGVLFKEIAKQEIKVGFRSKYNIDVSQVAEKFGGGGHKKASGCTIHGDIEKAKKIIIETMKNYI
jgi:phosphoesterase RecJ-like protein